MAVSQCVSKIRKSIRQRRELVSEFKKIWLRYCDCGKNAEVQQITFLVQILRVNECGKRYCWTRRMLKSVGWFNE